MTYKPKARDSVFACRWGSSKECTAAIDKIIAATGKGPDDRTALAKDLDGAHVICVHLDLHTEKRTGAKSLKNLRKTAEKLTTAINSNSLAKEATKKFDLDKLCDILRRLEAANRAVILRLRNISRANCCRRSMRGGLRRNLLCLVMAGSSDLPVPL
jgi:hypothetical protein